MGTNNKQRRAAKRRKQAAARRGTPRPKQAGPRSADAGGYAAGASDRGHDPGPVPGGGGGGGAGDLASSGDGPHAGRDPYASRASRAATGERSTARERPPSRDELAAALEEALRVIDRAPPAVLARVIDRLLVVPPLSLEVLDDRLGRELVSCFARGWTPADLIHAGGRSLGADAFGRLVVAVVADGVRRTRRRESLHQRWRDHIEDLADAADAARTQERGRPPRERLLIGLQVLLLVGGLPDLPVTIPPPGSAPGQANGGSSRLDPRMTARVRALLAKAESTTFEDEAEAFTAKAQELITRHAIDEALLHTTDDVGDPSVRRLVVDDPYADAKASLIASVARANRCRVVFSPEFNWVTAIGYDHDLDAVELLATSLLTQATGAMTRHGPVRDASGRSRTRSFRRSFLFGFGHRIGERLLAATDQEVAASAATDSGEARLLPVLAAREDRLDEAQAAAFPDLVSHRTTISNGHGWRAGKAAAELADLDLPAPHLPPR